MTHTHSADQETLRLFSVSLRVNEPAGFVGRRAAPPGNLCISGGQECIARDGWHLEKDRAYGGSIAIHDGADVKQRNEDIDTDRTWLKLTEDERISILDEDRTIYDYFEFRYDHACHRKYGDGLKCRDTWKRKKPR
jgi:hypothetical protein